MQSSAGAACSVVDIVGRRVKPQGRRVKSIVGRKERRQVNSWRCNSFPPAATKLAKYLTTHRHRRSWVQIKNTIKANDDMTTSSGRAADCSWSSGRPKTPRMASSPVTSRITHPMARPTSPTIKHMTSRTPKINVLSCTTVSVTNRRYHRKSSSAPNPNRMIIESICCHVVYFCSDMKTGSQKYSASRPNRFRRMRHHMMILVHQELDEIMKGWMCKYVMNRSRPRGMKKKTAGNHG